MATTLSLKDVEELVAKHASRFDRTMTRDRIHVFEDPFAYGDDSLIVQISTRRPEDRAGWIELQLRVSQDIRDALLEHGDERHPLLQIFEPEEWTARND